MKEVLTSSVCIKFGLMASFMRMARDPVAPMSSQVIGSPDLLFPMTILPRLAERRVSGEIRAKNCENVPNLHVGEIGSEGENSHALGGDSDVETGGESLSGFGSRKSGGDFSEVSIVDVDDSVPAEKSEREGDEKGRQTDQEILSGSMSSRANLLTSSSVRSSGLVLVMPSFCNRLNMIGANVRLPFLAGQSRLKSC